MLSLIRYASACLIVTAMALPAHAADSPKKEATPGATAASDSAAMMEKWKELATPGAGHKVLEALVGEWEVDCKSWMGGPDSQPMASKGKSSTKWLFEGRYLKQDFTGDMMGVPFQGLGFTGYDNFKKRYFSTWMDSMSTGFFYSEGSASGDGKTIEFQGKMDDPMTGEKDKTMKTVVRILSPDKHVMEMYDLAQGDKGKIMELTYTRRSKT